MGESGVHRPPGPVGIECFLRIAFHEAVIQPFDEEPFRLADAAGGLEGAPHRRNRFLAQADVPRRDAAGRPCHRKLRVEFRRLPVIGQRLLVAPGVAVDVTEGERPERLERRRRCLDQRHAVLAERLSRFAEPLPDARGRQLERRQHALPAGRLLERAAERFARLAGDGFDADRIARTEGRDRPGQQHRRPFAPADLERQRADDPFVRRTARAAEGRPDGVLRQNAQERRLLQVHRQRQPQRVVENPVRGRVLHVGQQHRIAVGEHQRGRLPRQEDRAGKAGDDHRQPRDEPQPRRASASGCRGGSRRGQEIGRRRLDQSRW